MELQVMHVKLIRAFIKVKKDVVELKAIARMHEDIIRRLNENEKALLAKIKSLEARPAVKQAVVTKVVKKVVKTAAKKKYIGAKSSMRLHSENCPFAQNIKKSNKVVFKSKIKPFGLGYKACECLK